MMEINEAWLTGFFQPYIYEPMWVYLFVCVFMLAASFGLPIPEELVIITTALVANMARHPELYPPPYAGAVGVDMVTLCIVSFVAVLGSDTIVYLIGKYFGARIIKTNYFQKHLAGKGWDKINAFYAKYGGFAAGVFRFTPGLRFPGHLSCGLLGIPLWKFLLVDGLAALLSVPTQVYLVATYGNVILKKMAEFKLYLIYAVIAIGIIWLIRKIYLKNTQKTLSQ